LGLEGTAGGQLEGAPMAEATARTSRWWVFRPPDSAGGIYGTIATMAVIAGAARGSSHGRVLALAVGTVAVFWLAHVYAPAGRPLETGRDPASELRR